MAKFELKIKARELRKGGKSLKEIAQSLGVSKSSVSLWCRDIILTEEQMSFLKPGSPKGGMKGRMMAAHGNRRKKKEAIAKAKEWAHVQVSNFNKRDLLTTGIALYWGEGGKAESTGTFNFSNSDPRMITLMYQWLHEFFGVTLEDLHLRVSINDMHEPRIGKVIDFWSELLQIERTRFKTSFIHTKQKKVYENYDIYYGVLSLRIKKGTVIRYKILALIEAVILENSKRNKSQFTPVGVAQLVVASDS